VPITFFVEDGQNRADSAWLRVPAESADWLLVALGHDPLDLVFFRKLRPGDVLARAGAVRRQFGLGRGREFTPPETEERRMLRALAELERLAQQAREKATSVQLL
jgi:hypothetical protein